MDEVVLTMQNIQESDTVQNLGLVMDHHMNFDVHVDQVCRRCTGLLIGLFKVRRRVPRRCLPTLVNGLVMSLLRYCLSIFGSCTKRNLTRLQRVMNFGARVIAGRKKRDSVSDVLHDLR